MFTRGSFKKVKVVAHKRQAKHKSTVMDNLVLFKHWLHLLTIKTLRLKRTPNKPTVALTTWNNKMKSKAACRKLSSETFDPNLDAILTQTNDLENKSNP